LIIRAIFTIVSNLDLEWLKSHQEHDMEVDIGYMPLMEVRSTGGSRPAIWEGKDLRHLFKPELQPADSLIHDLNWSQEIIVDECERAMELQFYPFKSVIKCANSNNSIPYRVAVNM